MISLLHARLGRRWARVRHDGERGVALITVIGLGAVLLILSATMVSVAIGGTRASRSDSDFNAAIAAAYAGVEDYQSKLANDNTYTQYGTKATEFSKTSTFTGTADNRAFGVGATGTWMPVGDSTTSSYRYEVDNSAYSKSGILRLRATGKVGTTTRSVVAGLKQKGFIDFLYFTDYEIIDPQLSNTSCAPAYDWAVTSRANCSPLQFGPADVIDGPLHTNDTLLICGATFNGTVTSANPGTPRFDTPSGCSAPTFAVSGSPAFAKRVDMPATNQSLRQEVRSDLKNSTVPRPGCLYTGPTTITFNSGGTMTVYSPYTVATNVAGEPVTSGSVAGGCGSPGFSASGSTLGSPGGQTLPVPANNLVFVQDVPSLASDPNFPKTALKSFSCTGADGKVAGNGVGFPVRDETPPVTSGDTISYGCTKGDVFVKGALKGNVTLAAANYVYVTGDLTYVDPAADMLGLVGQNAVFVHNPVRTTTTTESYNATCRNGFYVYTCTQTRDVSTSTLLDRSRTDRTVSAAILSVAHTFTVQNYNLDNGNPKGKLIINGAIAQKFRGAVATTQGGSIVTGYTKAYKYDTRLAFMAPPKFLSPVSTSYGISQLVESKTAFTAAGVEIK
jgi:Tfp pilus assembly protein PilX